MAMFKGGVHPLENKITSSSIIEELPIPDIVYIPLTQHIGAPAKPIVKVGDNVLTGQKIGEASGFISSNIHSSVTGVIKEIIDYPIPTGINSQCIVIETQNKDEFYIPAKTYHDYYRYPPKELVEVIKDNGVVGLGGAGFPTHVKLTPIKGKSIDTILINGAECEPYLTSDESLMLKHPKDIILGLNIMFYILSASKGIICIEDNKPKAIEAIKKEVVKHPNIEIKILKTKYPQGSEKQLIYSTIKKKIPPNSLPIDVGCLVENVGTVKAIKEAIYKGNPLTHRVVTVSGDNLGKPTNFEVRLGTQLKDVLAAAHFKKSASKIIVGGPMMGIAQSTIDVPIIKTSSGLLVFSEGKVKDIEYSDCIKCGKCIKVCPMNLLPNLMSVYSEKHMWDEFEKLNIVDCMECGSCAYICPAARPIVQNVKWAKEELRKRENS